MSRRIVAAAARGVNEAASATLATAESPTLATDRTSRDLMLFRIAFTRATTDGGRSGALNLAVGGIVLLGSDIDVDKAARNVRDEGEGEWVDVRAPGQHGTL